ncbi:MAG: 2-amino-4-hydroxy-6-hydroxymethyldihydropteridine diphosphokinase, partial [Candidatus Omnitrophica bacterium]|nr:2-amino-4-hydroxy-6-hydroxymethyldihydropteridine diphosphokinase [Candidatus Omnitrophota bacterium]
EDAMALLNATGWIKIEETSSIYETEPIGGPEQGKYLNGVIKLSVERTPKELLDRLLNIETILGRVRKEKNGPRTVDLDILYFDDMKINEQNLIIPHPRIEQREFVLKGLRELGVNKP